MTVIQKFTVFLSFAFILHEWEEGRYPGGFPDLMSKHLPQMNLDEENMLNNK